MNGLNDEPAVPVRRRDEKEGYGEKQSNWEDVSDN